MLHYGWYKNYLIRGMICEKHIVLHIAAIKGARETRSRGVAEVDGNASLHAPLGSSSNVWLECMCE
jgi:hypothetical protein